MMWRLPGVCGCCLRCMCTGTRSFSVFSRSRSLCFQSRFLGSHFATFCYSTGGVGFFERRYSPLLLIVPPQCLSAPKECVNFTVHGSSRADEALVPVATFVSL